MRIDIEVGTMVPRAYRRQDGRYDAIVLRCKQSPNVFTVAHRTIADTKHEAINQASAWILGQNFDEQDSGVILKLWAGDAE